jgi:DNA-binding response OmpR family regulator
VSPGKIVVIEEDLLVRAMLQCALPEGIEADCLEDEERAMGALSASRPEAIIIGKTSGKLSAGALCRNLRAEVAGQRLPIILMDQRYTDESLAATEVQAYDADAFVPVPFVRANLEAALEAARTRFAERSGALSVSRLAAADVADSGPVAPQDDAPHFSWTAFEERVKRIYRNLDRLDYYQVLELTPYASPAQVKDAYYGRSLEFHPDRFAQLEDRDVREKIYQIYKRVSEAFRELSDPTRRSEYDHAMGRARRMRSDDVPGRKLSLSVAVAAKRYITEALKAERDGDLAAAKSYLMLAHEVAPQNPDIKRKLDELLAKLGGE